ncbi:unnamed protein product, partial [Rotaria sp. Silwood1]
MSTSSGTRGRGRG